MSATVSTEELPRTRNSHDVLARCLRDSYAATLRCVENLDEPLWRGPYLPIVNPPLWEVGHVAWFAERWVLRRPSGAGSLLPNADALYDSSRIAHVARWFLPLPDPQATLDYLSRVTQRVLELLDKGRICDPDELYYVELSLHHEDMHNEAFRYTRQTLGLPDPFAGPAPDESERPCAEEGDVEIDGGTLMLGSTREDGWVFDNEKWAHPVDVPAFRMARRQVSNADFLAFVEDGGYGRRELWSDEGWRWRAERGQRAPIYWRRSDAGWEQRVYDRWIALRLRWPVLHVSCHEAEAYCRWAGRRLPSEAEWERAAATGPGSEEKRRYPWGGFPEASGRANLGAGYLVPIDACADGDSAWGVRQLAGNTWEWTSSSFEPYPGFSADPYRDYSRPWFGNHRVLRGGSFATEARIARCAYRNFYTPDRADVFAGFRTCAP